MENLGSLWEEDSWVCFDHLHVVFHFGDEHSGRVQVLAPAQVQVLS